MKRASSQNSLKMSDEEDELDRMETKFMEMFREHVDFDIDRYLNSEYYFAQFNMCVVI